MKQNLKYNHRIHNMKIFKTDEFFNKLVNLIREDNT